MKDIQREPVKLPSGLRWAGATTIGYALGMILSTSLLSSSVIRPLGSVFAGLLSVLIYGAVIGAVLGAFQVVVMPRGLASYRKWILITAIGIAIGFPAASVVAEAIGNTIDPVKDVVLNFAAITAIAGVIVGLAMGLGQGLILRHRLLKMRGWVVASVIGTVLGSLLSAVLLGLLESPLLGNVPSLVVGAFIGIGVGSCQALVFRANQRSRGN